MATRSSTLRLGKRARVGRSKSTSRAVVRRSSTRVGIPYPKRSVVAISRGVGLGASTTTVLRTSFFSNLGGSAFLRGYLKPGSCYDPCGDQSNIQPTLYDQFTQVYTRYKVVSATVHITISGAIGGGGVTRWVFAAFPGVDATMLPTYQVYASQQWAKTTSGGFGMSSPPLGEYIGLGSEPKHLWFKNLRSSAMVGSSIDPYDNGALVGADPPAGQYMVLPFCVEANQNSASSWVLEIDIFQTVNFSLKKNVVAP